MDNTNNMNNYIWWYYNKKYSETGGVFLELKNALMFISKEKILPINQQKIKKRIDKFGYYKDHMLELTKIRFYGDIKIKHNQLYILRYPNAIYVNVDKAYESGVKHIIKITEKSYYWSKNNDWENKTRTVCDDNWFKKVSDEDPINWGKIWVARIEEDEWGTENHIEIIESNKIFFR